MYNCRRRTKVVPVRRRCCLSSPQCNSHSHSHSLIPAYPIPSTILYYKKTMFCPSYTYHSSLYTPTCPASFNQVVPQSPSQVPDNLPSVTNTPSGHITQLNPAVRNRNLLNTMFKVSLKEEMCFVMTRSNSVFLCLVLTTFFSVQERRPSTTIYPRYNKSSKELLFIS